MQIIHALDIDRPFDNAVATLGSFDGVHCGHRVLLNNVVKCAKAVHGESIVMTFEPHPRITLNKAEGLRLLSTLEEKAALMEAIGIDYLVVIPFDEAFSRLSKEEFIEQYVIRRIGIKHLIVGYNHRFGHNNEGDFGFLAGDGRLKVEQVSQHLVADSKVSSTIIRHKFEEGDLKNAIQLLGHPYIIIGNCDANGVVETDSYKLLPPDGEYTTKINGVNDYITIRDGKVLCDRPSGTVKIEIYDFKRC